MKTFNKILLACDIQSNAGEVLAYGCQLAGELQAELVILNVISQRDLFALKKAAVYSSTFSEKKYLNQWINSHIHQLELLLEKYHTSDLQIRKTVKVGLPFKEIIETAEEENVDLIVIGPKKQFDLSKLFYSSTADKLFRCSPIPLLSVRPKHIPEQRYALHHELTGKDSAA
jgi:nucleotide-binding universal stress UspA family protein